MEGSVENEKDETTIAERALRDGARCWDDAWCDLGVGCSDVSGHGRAEDLRICHVGDGAEHWLVAEGDVTIDGRVAVAGDVSLILADGAMLVVDGGIDVPAGAGFTIYAQSDGDNQGILEAYGEEFSGEGSAGIGGNEEDVNFGDIVICGGLIYAEGGTIDIGYGTVTVPDEGAGAGVGSGSEGTCDEILIYGGSVTVGTDKAADSTYIQGAGIGSGSQGHCGKVSISRGSEITVHNDGGGAGIGSGDQGSIDAIEIYGGTIDATGGAGAAGIGSGCVSESEGTTAITILDGKITATGGTAEGDIGGAGIGSGGVGTPCAITITGGTIAATGGVQADDIGNGYDTTGSSFTTGENGHALITAETVLGGSVTVVPFVDVQPDDWYIDVVKYALENGLMTGVSETEFAPDLATTRGMVASVLYRLEGGPEAEDAGFSDVSADAWYADAVNWAASVGVVAGYGDAFGANDAITREQLAAILCNYAAYKGEDVSSGAALDGYSDAASVSDWAGESVEWAVAEGLLSGVTNNELAPQGSAARAQVAAMLQRFNAR